MQLRVATELAPGSRFSNLQYDSGGPRVENAAGRFAVKRHGRALLEEIMLCTQDLMRARIRREHDGLANAWNTFDFVEGNMPVVALFIVEYQGSLIYNFGLIHIVAHCSQSSYFVGFSLPAWNVLTDSVTPWEADSLREMGREGPLMIWKLLN